MTSAFGVMAAEAARHSLPGGRFVLLEVIDEGGHSIVWRARDLEMYGPVAIKILRSRDPERQRRFVTEAALLANISHPNILRARARGVTEEGWPYVVLDLLSGASLQRRLDARGPLSWREAVDLGVQAAAGLVALHHAGIIHRDLKPANLVLADDADGARRLKLIDVGVARVTAEWEPPDVDFPSGPGTDLGVIVGTPGYTPPKAGERPADERFDVFSLGATLYQLCTGELPQPGPVRPLHEARPACDAPPDLSLVLAAALAVDPDDRTRSAAELGRALAAVRDAHPEQRSTSLIDGRYDRVRLLGTGARGDVFLTTHRGSGLDVALKFLRSTDPDEPRRFEREARILAAINHPGLPRYFDYAPHATPPYIAMGFAAGSPAVRYCLVTDEERLTPHEVAAVGLQLAQVLAVLHARGVIHRDINANNVMIAFERGPVVKLIDLGCAEVTETFHEGRRYLTPREARVAIPDGGIGQLPWSAPEARAGRGWTDRSDVYSLGLLLYRLLTGKVPPKDAARSISRREFARACPDELASAVICALNQDPEDRPSAAQLATMLQDVLADEDADLEDEPEAAAVSHRPGTTGMGETGEPSPGAADGSPPASPEPATPPQGPHGATAAAHASSPDESTRAAVPVSPDQAVPPALDASRRPGRWSVPAAVLVIAAVASITWWMWSRAATVRPVAGEEASPDVSAERRREQLAPPKSTSADGRPPATPPPQPPAPSTTPLKNTREAPAKPVAEALETLTPDLRACAARSGGVLLLEFTAEGDAFTRVEVQGPSDEALVRCVEQATAPLRFQPTSEQFIREYKP